MGLDKVFANGIAIRLRWMGTRQLQKLAGWDADFPTHRDSAAMDETPERLWRFKKEQAR